jgi:hypothetical protein
LPLARVGEPDQLLKFRESGAGGDGAVRELGSGKEVLSDVGDDEGSGGVHYNGVVRRAWFTLENSAQESGVFLWRAATEGFARSGLHAKVGG